MVWACFSSKGVGEIKIINEIMNSEEYCRILHSSLLKSADDLHMKNFIFQQDNNPKHTSALITEYLDIKRIKTMSWPPQSPDMNPIENLWHYLKTKIAQRNPKNIRELGEITIEEWKRIPKDMCQRLVDSMKKRVFDLWLAKGSHTRY